MSTADPASQFYTGLVAELYEPLVSYRARADEYVPFLDRSGQPVLEIACGSGVPMLDLLRRGYDVEGLDASQDMLALCREKAAAILPDGSRAPADARSFVFIARRDS